MLAIAAQTIDIVLNIWVIVWAAKWAARRTSRTSAVSFSVVVAFVYSIVSDFSIEYATPDYDRSFDAVAGNALITAMIGLAIAFFVTRRSRLKQAMAPAKIPA